MRKSISYDHFSCLLKNMNVKTFILELSVDNCDLIANAEQRVSLILREIEEQLKKNRKFTVKESSFR